MHEAPNILLLEDQPGWEALIASAIRESEAPDCQVLRARTYSEAMDLLSQHHFHVALLDYSLSKAGAEATKTGLDVAEALRATAPSATILLITLVDPERLRARCEELGVRLVEKGRGDLPDEIVREVREGLRAKPERR